MSSESSRIPPLALLFVCLFLDLLGFGIIVPLLPFMALRLGASAQEVTLLMATYSGALLLAAPLWGLASDRFGRKPVLLVAFCGTAAAFTIIAFADQLWMLFLARGLAGLLSGDLAAAPAYAADVSPPEKRAKAMGILGAAFGLAFTIGPGIGGFLIGDDPQAEGYRTIPLISAALSTLTLVVAALFLPEPRRRQIRRAAEVKDVRPLPKRFVAALHFRHIGLIVLIVFLISVVFSSMESTLALWAEVQLEWGPRQVGYLFVFAGAIVVICQGGLIGPLTRHLGEARVLVGATFFLALGMWSVAAAESLPPLLFAISCLAVGIGLSNPALQSLVSRLSHAESTGGALGLSQSTSSFARVCGPPLAGLLFERFGHGAPYVFGGLVMLVVVALAAALRSRLSREAVAAPIET